MIERLVIQNYRAFRDLDLELDPGMNILVGANNTGKSTVIEAINLGLTNRLNGRPFSQEISPYLVNREATLEYISQLEDSAKPAPPTIVIELYFTETDETAPLRGTNNLRSENACGLRLQASLSGDFLDEYLAFANDPGSARLVPTEYYRVDWLGFSGSPISARSIPAVASVIDPANLRLHAGVDFHLQQILRAHLSARERVELARKYRSFREEFGANDALREVNRRLQDESEKPTSRDFAIGVDVSQGQTWENSLAAYIDQLPFALIGRGDQNSVKTLLAIGRKSREAHVVLIEEPEAHLSFSALRQLLFQIQERCVGKQLIVATHSAYVLNKLGLDNLTLLAKGGITRMADLPEETIAFFRRLAGYDTLRLALADGAFLVEGPSDELIVQRAYADVKGRFPIEDGIDVISVGRSHKRFLEIAVRLGRRVRVVVDNDGASVSVVKARFSEFAAYKGVSIHTGPDPEVRTLEPQIVEANDLDTLGRVLGRAFATKADVTKYMTSEKTAAALAIFESDFRINMPSYIREAVEL